MKLAIVILNWNGAEMMKQYLPSVIRCSQMEDVAVIVADNASTDASLDVLQKRFPEVQTIQLDQNYGFAEGYNRALRQIDATYYLLLNSDVEIRQSQWVKPMICYMDAHPECAICQPKLMKLKDEHKRPNQFEYAGAAGGFLDRYGYPFCRGRIFDTIEMDKGQYDHIEPLLWATGAALMIRSADYWNAGGLDGRFFAHMEEIDLCWRLRCRGRQIVCISESEAFHLGGASLSQGHPRKTFLNFRNNLLMLYKNLPQSDLQSVMRMRSLLDHVAAIRFLLQGDWANARAVWAAKRAFRKMKADFAEDRADNLRNSITDPLAERKSFSILWQYYFHHRHTYQQLPA